MWPVVPYGQDSTFSSLQGILQHSTVYISDKITLGSFGKCTREVVKRLRIWPGEVAQAFNLRYLGGGDQEDGALRTS